MTEIREKRALMGRKAGHMVIKNGRLLNVLTALVEDYIGTFSD